MYRRPPEGRPVYWRHPVPYQEATRRKLLVSKRYLIAYGIINMAIGIALGKWQPQGAIPALFVLAFLLGLMFISWLIELVVHAIITVWRKVFGRKAARPLPRGGRW